jgi:hypothetical protein
MLRLKATIQGRNLKKMFNWVQNRVSGKYLRRISIMNNDVV